MPHELADVQFPNPIIHTPRSECVTSKLEKKVLYYLTHTRSSGQVWARGGWVTCRGMIINNVVTAEWVSSSSLSPLITSSLSSALRTHSAVTQVHSHSPTTHLNYSPNQRGTKLSPNHDSPTAYLALLSVELIYQMPMDKRSEIYN